MCIMFWKTSSKSLCFCLKPTTQCTFTERILHSFVCLNVSNVLKKSFWKPLLLLRARHSVYFHRANILSIVCLNVYNVLKKFFWKPLLLREAHDSLYFQRVQTLFNCMFECVWCFEKLLLKAIASASSPPLTVPSQSACFLQLFVWMCKMIRKTSSGSHCFCLKPTIQCAFTDRILCSIVCLNVYNVLKNFFWKPLFLFEAHHSVYFDRAHTFFNCMFDCV